MTFSQYVFGSVKSGMYLFDMYILTLIIGDISH